jgi:small subunit ribosomal protein S5
MNETTNTQSEVKTGAPARSTTAPARPGTGRPPARGGDRRDAQGRDNRRRPRRDRMPRQRSEFDNKILGIRRVTRVVAGGRRFSFSVTIVIGNGKGKVGVGLGKASDTALAIEKATNDAKRNLITVPITEADSIPHEVRSKYGSSVILLIPTPGKGLKAGSAVRTVLEMAGVKHVSGKILTRSKNPLNNARATVVALQNLKAVHGKMKKAPQKKVPAAATEEKMPPKKTVEKKEAVKPKTATKEDK